MDLRILVIGDKGGLKQLTLRCLGLPLPYVSVIYLPSPKCPSAAHGLSCPLACRGRRVYGTGDISP